MKEEKNKNKKSKSFKKKPGKNSSSSKSKPKKPNHKKKGFTKTRTKQTATNKLKSKSKKEYEGLVYLRGNGDGIIRSSSFEEPIEISSRFLRTSLHRDKVIFCLHTRKGKGSQKAEVIDIIKRNKQGFAGVLEFDNGSYYLNPDDPKMPFDILIPKKDLKHAKEGQKVYATISLWEERQRLPSGRIEQVLGSPGDNDVEMKAIALEKGFDESFPKDVEREAAALKKPISEEEIKKRRDMRGTTTFTIDPYDAKDFDDALSYKELPDGKLEIGVHIADVSHYVQKGTALDDEAYRRATSVYLVDRTIPMLPEVISNDLCSLNPHTDKLAFSVVMKMDKEGKVFDTWFGRTVIYSDRRFTYEEAQNRIESSEGDFADEIVTMNNIAKKLTKKRFASGALSLESPEVKFSLDEKGHPVGVLVKERKDSNKMIEEFMLLANQLVAKFTAKTKSGQDRISIFRIHGSPEKDRVKRLVEFLDLLGYKLETEKGEIPPKTLNKIVAGVEPGLLNNVQTAIIRSMQKAIYTTKNIGHYGLAFEYYTHFTSPIRRYPDLMIHRILQTYIDGKTIPKTKRTQYEEWCTHSSEQEKEAMGAERASIKYKQVEYMTDHIGKKFEGVITGLTSWGIYVEEKSSKSEGMVSLRLMDDYYSLDEGEYTMKGKDTGREFRMGDTVNIEVLKTDMEAKTIDYKILLDE